MAKKKVTKKRSATKRGGAKKKATTKSTKAAKKKTKKAVVTKADKKAAKTTKRQATKKATKSAAKKRAAKPTVKKTSRKKVEAPPAKVVKAPAAKRAAKKKSTKKAARPRLQTPPVEPTPLRPAPARPVMEPANEMPAVGTFAPDFELVDGSGHAHRLSDYHGRRVVIYFYPKDDTPGCTTEACGFRDKHQDYASANAAVLGISPDTIESHERFAQKFALPFPLLADPEHAVAEHYGVWGEKTMYGRTHSGVFRTTFVIDADGRIAHVFNKVQADGHAEEVLEYLRTN